MTIMRIFDLLRQWCLLSLMIVADGVQTQKNLTFILITSFGQNGFNSSGLIPAADMALEDINSNSQVLPGYNLMYDTLRDSEVSLLKNPQDLLSCNFIIMQLSFFV